MIGWLDCSAGASGDMLLGALVDAGASLATMQHAVNSLGVEPIQLRVETVTRGGLGATRVHVQVAEQATHRTWADIRELLVAAPLSDDVRRLALDVFARLARAEGNVHRAEPESIQFHEVGGLDAIADVVGAAAGVTELGLTELTSSPVALGSGSTRGAHGPLPVPVPAVLALLADVQAPVVGGAAPMEMTTPTGAALVASLVTGWGTLPAMSVHAIGSGAGARDPAEVANLLRLVIGTALPSPAADPDDASIVLSANVDDLDPRLWPAVLQRLMDAGAADAWLTPILMKKGRPAHELSVLCSVAAAASLRRVIFAETSTIGMREHRVDKHALDRTETTVDVAGMSVRVKVAVLDGAVLNIQPEWEDVAAAADALGRPVKQVLLAAQAAALAASEDPKR
ncbi:MAG TPA: nickel pincer cofactor biosynthesis protein LarC [Mycobacteriales bacterium]|nr:nickel pincer cofactor biosynthesis protein LarC [Mycobacteriales bacterium]